MGYLRRTAALLAEMLRRFVSALRSVLGWPENNHAADLPDELIVEILSRLPAKSVCRFKCVSHHWLHGLITHLDHRAKIPQTLTGFFRQIENENEDDIHSDGDDSGEYDDGVLPFPAAGDDAAFVFPFPAAGDDAAFVFPFPDAGEDDEVAFVFPAAGGDGVDVVPFPAAGDDAAAGDDDAGYESWDDATIFPDFLGITGENAHLVASPSLSFLPGDVYRSICPKHSSDGLVVCLCWRVSPVEESDIVVCNPATQQRVTLPGHGHRDRSFMPLHLAVSASGHFHVFALLRNHHGSIGGVDIYSSEEGAWSHEEARWDHDVAAPPYRHSVFLHGMLHLVTRSRAIVAVDTKGSRWETIQLLEDMKPKYWSNAFLIGKSQGSLHYVSNGHGEYYCTLSVWMLQGNGEWIHKHRISTQALFRTKYPVVWHDMLNISLVAIHPERNTIFFAVAGEKGLMSYDMDGKCRGKSRVRGLLNCQDDGSEFSPYLPYVPSWRSIPL